MAASDLVVRPATAADDAACADLFARTPMAGDLVLSVDRRADFSALYRLQGGTWTCWVGEADGALLGMGTVGVRAGHVDGRPAPIGYLGDLRLAPEARGRGLLGRFYGPALADAVARTGAQVFLTAVIASNRAALAALTGSRAAARGIPPYTPLRRFAIRSIHRALPRHRRRTGYRVRRAVAADVPAIAALLDDDGRARPYGDVVPEAELHRRLAAWPGLAVGDFLLAEDAGGALAGCAALWDPSAVKRTVVVAYRGRMRLVRAVHDAAATLLRCPRLPAPGRALPYAYLTHQAIPSQDPEVLAALLAAAHGALRRSHWTLLSACVWEGDPLGAAYRGLVTTDLPAHLYAVTPPGAPAPRPCGPDERPGFEMALA